MRTTALAVAALMGMAGCDHEESGPWESCHMVEDTLVCDGQSIARCRAEPFTDGLPYFYYPDGGLYCR